MITRSSRPGLPGRSAARQVGAPSARRRRPPRLLRAWSSLHLRCVAAPTRDGRHDLLLRLVSAALKSPASLPSRSTKMRSATSNTSARLWLITTTPWPSLAQAVDQREHLGSVWRDAERGRRLVEHHEPAARRAGSARSPPAGAGRPRACRPRRARSTIVTRERGPAASRVRCSIAVSSSLRVTLPTPSRTALLAQEEVARRRRGCRTARGPGRRSRFRAATASSGPWIETSRPSNEDAAARRPGGYRRSSSSSVDLPAPLSPTSATTSPRRTSKSTPLSAWTAPKLLLIPFRASAGVLFAHLIAHSWTLVSFPETFSDAPYWYRPPVIASRAPASVRRSRCKFAAVV